MALCRVRGQRGAGSIGCLFMLALIAAAIYAGFMFAMPKLRHASFSDRLNESMYHMVREPEDLIRKQIMEMATEFDVALTPEQVKIQTDGPKLTIDITYEKEVDLRYWKTTLPFELHREATR